jgi:hypothetical protein
MVHDQTDLGNTTAILITYDEGGGYYDSGYIQPVDFFGDGTRIPLIAVSPFAKKGFVDHTYYDHVSILKFIERNCGLNPLSARSRDNLPNPVQPPGTYVPTNGPAIGNLGNLFNLNRFRPNAPAISRSSPSRITIEIWDRIARPPRALRRGRVCIRGSARSIASQFLFSDRRIAFELLRQPHKDAIGVPRPGSWNARRSPAQRGLPAEFSHLSDHESLPM